MTTLHSSPTGLDDFLPAMTYRELAQSLEMVAQRPHRSMIPYLVSALREQAPFLNGQMILFEIMRSAHCLADEPLVFSSD